MNYIVAILLGLSSIGIYSAKAYSFDIRGGVTLELRSFNKTFSSQNITVWTYCLTGLNVSAVTPGSCLGAPTFPGPLLEIGAGQSVNVTLSLTNTVNPIPNEDPSLSTFVPSFFGHTIHFANLHLPAIHDGVPRPFPPISGTQPTNTSGHTYTIDLGPSNSGHIGGHAYYCHVHQTKHLEMGEFGALIVRPLDANGNFAKQINENNNPDFTYDAEAIFLLSTIDPSYHFLDIVGEDPVFSTYSPTIFLVNGNEGASKATPASTVIVAAGITSTKVAIRLIGMHSVNATFQIFDDNSTIPAAQNFVLHNIDGRAQQNAKTLQSVELSPGQSKDIMITMPTNAGTTWYPEITYTHLRDGASLAKVISAIVIQ